MKRRICVRSMVLGAVILALGIIIGQWVTPDIKAQNNGVFDKITCREIEVIDKDGKVAIVLAAIVGRPVVALHIDGKPAVTLGANPFRNFVRVYGKNGKPAVVLATSENSNEVMGYGKDGKQAVALVASENSSGVTVFGKDGKRAVGLVADGEFANVVIINDPAGKESFRFNAYSDRNELIVRDKSSGAGIGFYGDSNEVKQTKWNK